MRKLIFIFSLTLFLFFMGNTKTGVKVLTELNEFYKTPSIIMDNQQFYVWDKTLVKVFIYTKKDFKKIAEFGKRGEAPGEFIGISYVSVDENYIYVSSFPKLCFFTKKGKLEKELKGPPEAGTFFPAGNHYVGKSYPYTNPYSKKILLQYSLFDSNLKKKRDLSLIESQAFVWPGKTKQNARWIRPCIKAVSYKNNIFIGNSNEKLLFSVFDSNGNLLYKIDKDLKKRSVTENDKNTILNNIKKELGEKWLNNYKAQFNFVFPHYYPAFSNFYIDDDKIYIFLFPGEKSLEFQVFDLKGKFLRNSEIPLLKYNLIEGGHFTINNGKLYYIADNFETEKWEIHEIDLK